MEMNEFEQVGARLMALESTLEGILAQLRTLENAQQQLLAAVQGNEEILTNAVQEHDRKMTVVRGG